ncbi:hypothetical protein WDU94_015141 [Cyamophila willieti]
MSELNELRCVLQALALERDTLRNTNEELNKALCKMKADQNKIRAICQENKEVVAVMEEEYRTMKKEYCEMRERCCRARTKRKQCCEDMKYLEAEYYKLRSCQEKTCRENEQLKQIFKQYANETRCFKTGVEELRASSAALQKENRALRQRINELQCKTRLKCDTKQMKKVHVRPYDSNRAKRNQKYVALTCKLQKKLDEMQHQNVCLARRVQDLQKQKECVYSAYRTRPRMRSYPFRVSSQRSFYSPQNRRPQVRSVYETRPFLKAPHTMPFPPMDDSIETCLSPTELQYDAKYGDGQELQASNDGSYDESLGEPENDDAAHETTKCVPESREDDGDHAMYRRRTPRNEIRDSVAALRDPRAGSHQRRKMKIKRRKVCTIMEKPPKRESNVRGVMVSPTQEHEFVKKYNWELFVKPFLDDIIGKCSDPNLVGTYVKMETAPQDRTSKHTDLRSSKRNAYDLLFHPDLDYDQKASRSDRTRGDVIRQRIHEQELGRVIPLTSSHVIGHGHVFEPVSPIEK